MVVVNCLYVFESIYVVMYNENGVLGLVIQCYEDYVGVYGMIIWKGYIFVFDIGKELSFDDVL